MHSLYELKFEVRRYRPSPKRGESNSLKGVSYEIVLFPSMLLNYFRLKLDYDKKSCRFFTDLFTWLYKKILPKRHLHPCILLKFS